MNELRLNETNDLKFIEPHKCWDRTRSAKKNYQEVLAYFKLSARERL